MNMPPTDLSARSRTRDAISAATLRDEAKVAREIEAILESQDIDWPRVQRHSIALIEAVRSGGDKPLIDDFLTEFGLSNDEGVRLMRLAEALSRVRDPRTADALIRDKIGDGNWWAHAAAGRSLPLKAAAGALTVASAWLNWSGKDRALPARVVGRVGDATMQQAVRAGIRALSGQFVFAEKIEDALVRAEDFRALGYSFSFDMLGEAARSHEDAAAYYHAYEQALERVAANARHDDPADNDGISVKLSALHPRYEYKQADTALPAIVDRLLPLARTARSANVQLTIDAEEAERLDLSLDILAALVAHPDLRGWRGLGFVVQAYQRRALPLIDHLAHMSERIGAPLHIRLVKGAYWDSEIKRAQQMGLPSYPVFTRKETTDASYMACAIRLLDRPDRFVPQFATHNAHSIAAMREFAGPTRPIELQRLFGMGRQLHNLALGDKTISSRIYAPVGTQQNLLSYLVRRLLENGANSSFVNKLSDPGVGADILSPAPSIPRLANDVPHPGLPEPRRYLGTGRVAARGVDLSDPPIRADFQRDIDEAARLDFVAQPTCGKREIEAQPVRNPADVASIVGTVYAASDASVEQAVGSARQAFAGWTATSSVERAAILQRAADLLEQRAPVFHHLAIAEAGKTWEDAIDEVREAVDFCRYYAEQIGEQTFRRRAGLGVIACISPWNFPLAIFLGQVAGSLAAGNTVVAKPAEQSPLIAAEAVRLLYEAGVPEDALHLLPGSGKVGAALVAHADIAGVCFTGSTATAQAINRTLAGKAHPRAALIAETGGINAMIADSSALPEQLVDAVLSSAFQSAGQRCSALRILCLQEDMAEDFLHLLGDAMQTLNVGDPRELATDIGPAIDKDALERITDHVDRMTQDARIIARSPLPGGLAGHFVAPTVFELDRFQELDREIFGPVLHVVRYPAGGRSDMIDAINASGYGLTLGLESRIDFQNASDATRARVGNVYINRNQIGAVVGVQPFGGHGLSGTGPKAGGPLYLLRLSENTETRDSGDLETASEPSGDMIPTFTSFRAASEHVSKREEGEHLLEQTELPSPAGETNVYRLRPRGVIVSLLSDPAELEKLARVVARTGNRLVHAVRGTDPAPDTLLPLPVDRAAFVRFADDNALHAAMANDAFDAVVIADGDRDTARSIAPILAERPGALIPILSPFDEDFRFVHEQTVTENTAATGGDVALLNL